ncbi:hypothetical protein MNBD_GAMMA21-2219 [hydrothermal vent metagenome]|uniref:SPOR domain-containing protein n=1 Tax=hydrothermal vent metagenome TaxID=652676 RepID=A0A3B1AJK4_9ZZZZ
MKWAIYILILTNLGFGLLHYRSVILADNKTPADDDNLRLVLLKEFLEQEGQTVAVSDDVSSSIETVARCNTLGPFKSKKSANKVRKRLVKLGLSAERRMSKDNKRKGYWVMIPPAESRKIAKQSVRELKKKEINDYFLVVTGEQRNAVSLGVFSRSELAQKRYDEIIGLGFTAKIRQVDLPLREYWLDWPSEQSLLPDDLATFRKKHPNIGQTDRPCS